MTAWILVLVPVLVLAVVTLFAFAGCNVIAGIERGRLADYWEMILGEGELRGYWRLGEAQNDDSARDRASHQLKGTYFGGVRRGIDGAVSDDKSADFDGIDDFIEVPYDAWINPPLAFSIEAWVRPTPTTQGELVVVSSYEGFHGFELSILYSPTVGIAASVKYADGTQWRDTSQQVVGAGAEHHGWFHIVGTCAQAERPKPPGTEVILYVDKALIAHHVYPADQPYVAADFRMNPPFRIGGRVPSPSLNNPALFEGGIDEVALYGEALARDTIEKHFDWPAK
jgi:Concanavalin A-like lectin/glucanases superfamily